ncbi:MAG: hypothetical protein HWE07_09530 [Cytophagia bacterium]|nr:hypothetical protein [Cytophagia bacterium]
MVRNLTITFLIIILPLGVLGQEPDSLRLSQSIQIGTGILATNPVSLPFWMKHNNSGRFTDKQAGAMYSLIHYNGGYQTSQWLRQEWEVETMASASSRGIYGSVIQANFSVVTPIVRITAGLDEEVFGLNDSTLSFGSLSYGNNARPLPKVSIGTKGWVKSPFLSRVFSFKAYLAHGWFEKDRVQSGAFLHQKYFYGRAQFFQRRFELIGGFHDNAMWAGKNLNTEIVQPSGFKNFARVFFGMNGGDDALQTDQLNALGNHLGSFDLRGSYKFRDFTVSSYWQFLWEDGSGMTISKWRDGLGGLSIKLKDKAIIDRFVFEIVRTNDQNAYKTDENGDPFIEPDNFFNNGVYSGGWTNYDRVIGTPLFLIFDVENSKANNIQNMVNAFNIGLGGHFKSLDYTLKYTDFKNNGRIKQPLEPSLYVRSLDLAINYQFQGNSGLGLRAVYQDSNLESSSSFGLQFSYRWKFNF